MDVVTSLSERLRHVLETRSAALSVPGAVVGVSVGEERIAMAHGVANLNTGQAFTSDTGFLLGSVTKIIMTTALLRLVERGLVDLDAPAAQYVPEFTLRDPDAARRITVRMLVNHTNGMDGDWLLPSEVRGRDTSKSYTAMLARMDVLFEPGTFVHYSNPGFVVAARVMEELTGLPFERAIEQELFKPCGMMNATAVQTQAFLRRTAVGAYADPDTKMLSATPMFTLGESLAGGGSTLIVTADDMLAFGRMHLNGGVAPNGERVLASEWVGAMQTPTFDSGLPQAPPIGLGWWLFPISGTTAPWHGGGSPGGTSSFCILPEHDAVVVSFATGGGRSELNDLLHRAVVEELTGKAPAPPFDLDPQAPPDDVDGAYSYSQVRSTVGRDGDELVVTSANEPLDDDHRRTMEGYGVSFEPRVARYRSVAPRQFAPAGMAFESLAGFYGRAGLLATLPATAGRRAGLHQGFRYTPKVGP